MRTKMGRLLSFSTWLEALQEAISAAGGESGHWVQLFQRRFAVAISKRLVFG
jgi:hypothetical protein